MVYCWSLFLIKDDDNKMEMKGYVEMFATIINLISNGFMLYVLCTDVKRRVHPGVLVLQLCANSCWISFSFMQKDYYLFTTSSTSFVMQFLSLYMLSKSQPTSSHVKLSISDDQLPQVPLKKNMEF